MTEPKKIGRPCIGKERAIQVSVMLPPEKWAAIVEAVGDQGSKSATLRTYLDAVEDWHGAGGE